MLEFMTVFALLVPTIIIIIIIIIIINIINIIIIIIIKHGIILSTFL